MSTAIVKMFGTVIGAVVQDKNTGKIRFNYTDEFLEMRRNVSPLMMPLAKTVYEFPNLYDSTTFRGLPGLLADSMPDKFGNKIISQYLAENQIKEEEFLAVDRLLYTGKRGMGALEYEPSADFVKTYEESIELERLVKCANEILKERKNFQMKSDEVSMAQLMSVGTSAGGARAKAVIAWNRQTGDIRSGQTENRAGYEHWLIKFDGVNDNKDEGDLEPDPKCLTRIEYAYHLMALDAGIEMSPCELKEENGFYHFMTKRFDRTDDGKKIHVQTLGAMAHFDLKDNAGTNSYEQAAFVIRELGLGQKTLNQFFRRAVFNVCGKNHDDHVKNTSFLMNRDGDWSLAPAYDLTFSYKPGGKFTNTHHLSLNGKLDNFELEDILAFAKKLDVSPKKAREIIDDVQCVFANWKNYATRAKVPEKMQMEIAREFRRF